MNPTPEYVALVQREREARVESDRLARLVARVKKSCNPSVVDRLARILRGTPATC